MNLEVGNMYISMKLIKNAWFKTVNNGESKIAFKQPQVISKIILHKASVGLASFKRGYVYLETQPASGSKWIRIFQRKGDDVDINVVINDNIKFSPLIQAVRIRFKSAYPITIGPINIIS